MREKTFHVYVDSHDRSLLLQSLVELKNLLIQQGRYTDCVDELIFKVINAPLKKIKTFFMEGRMNEIDLKELFKVAVETLWEQTIHSLLEADMTYQKDSENER